MPPTYTLQQLRDFAKRAEPVVTDEYRSALYSFYAEQGFPVTTWATGEMPVVFTDAWAESLSHMQYYLSDLADGMSIITAQKASQQDRVGASQYDEERKPAQFVAGEFRFENTSGIDQTIPAGALVRTKTGTPLTYRVTAGVLVPAGETRSLPVSGYEAGSKHNCPTGTPLELVTGIAGIEVSCPPLGASQTWILTLGTEVESLLEYRIRCQSKWATLGTGSPLPAYEKWALDFVGVTRAKAHASIGYGQIALYIDAPSLVATLQDMAQPAAGYGRAPFGSKVTVAAASVQTVEIPSVVRVKRQFRAQVEARVTTKMAQLSSATAIGGLLVKSEIIKRIKGALAISDNEEAVVDFAFNDTLWAGSPNLQLGASSIPIISTAQVEYVSV